MGSSSSKQRFSAEPPAKKPSAFAQKTTLPLKKKPQSQFQPLSPTEQEVRQEVYHRQHVMSQALIRGACRLR